MKQESKYAASRGTALAHQESTGDAARLPAEETTTMTYGQFSGPALKELTFELTVSQSESVPAALYEYVKLRAQQNVRCLNPRSYFQAKDLIGLDGWHAFGDDARHMAEVCIAHLYQSGALLLGSSGFGLTYPDIYHLTGGASQKSS